MPDPLDLRLLLSHAVPALLLLGSLTAGRASLPIATSWRRARLTVALSGTTALAAAACGWPTAGSAVLLLVAFIGWVITRYAATYLAGEPGQHAFVRWLLATLAGSSLVVATDHLAVLAVAWLGTSLSLGNLLTFYGDRPAAQMAAHKKFLVSRLAELCMVGALVLFAHAFGTLHIPALLRLAADGPALAPTAQVGVVLVALAVLLKSAQLPFHGWLMQVMEAPTPVSALLHAGVVNLGGFVLIRLAPLVGAVTAAQVLLVVVGSLTAALAALVMTTRISIKVALAWSTCAQMGFMVMQCGLGLPEMALLHLVAHSLYKAHSFLNAGTTVQQFLVRTITPKVATAAATVRVLGAALGVGVALAAGWLTGMGLGEQPAMVAMAGVVALAVAPLTAGSSGTNSIGWRLRAPVAAFAVAVAYFTLHRLLHGWLAVGTPSASAALALWVVTCFVLLFLAQSTIAARPQGALSRRLHARFYGGLFLDEWFTRLTLRVWPVRPAVARTTPPTHAGASR